MRYRIRGSPVVYKCFVFVLKLRTFKILYNVLDLTLKECNPAYLSEKRPFKCVVRPRKHLIDRFLWTYSSIKWAILTWELQKNVCKNRAKKSRYWKGYQIFAGIFKSFKLTARILPAFNNSLNTTKVVRSRLKLLEKPF